MVGGEECPDFNLAWSSQSDYVYSHIPLGEPAGMPSTPVNPTPTSFEHLMPVLHILSSLPNCKPSWAFLSPISENVF